MSAQNHSSQHPSLDAAQLPPPTTVGEDSTKVEADIDDIHFPYIGKRRREMFHFWVSFGFVDIPPSVPKKCNSSSSGTLLPKFGPVRHNFKLPPKFDRQAAENPRRRQPSLLKRHIQSRLTPYEKLPVLPLNPTSSRPNLRSRKNITLDGSEDFVQLDCSHLDAQLSSSVQAFSGTTRQPMYPPPPRRKKMVLSLGLNGILFEQKTAQNHLDSDYMFQCWEHSIKRLSRAVQSSRKAGSVSPELLAQWKHKLVRHRCLMRNLLNVLARETDKNNPFYIGRDAYFRSIAPKFRWIRKTVNDLSSPTETVGQVSSSADPQDAPQLEGAEVPQSDVQIAATTPNAESHATWEQASLSGNSAPQPLRSLCPRKRTIDEVATQGSSIQLIERPTKRRRTE
ncbi:hypothetical protein FRC07_014536 [Ceratobasidium sp. 392]|nr:hypothetical protein FRC07_014536 [Ceratobasidium sp. 392]